MLFPPSLLTNTLLLIIILDTFDMQVRCMQDTLNKRLLHAILIQKAYHTSILTPNEVNAFVSHGLKLDLAMKGGHYVAYPLMEYICLT